MRLQCLTSCKHTLDLAGGGTKGSWVWNSAEGNSTAFAGLAAGLLPLEALLSAFRSEGNGEAGAGKEGSLPGTTSFIAPVPHSFVFFLREEVDQNTSAAMPHHCNYSSAVQRLKSQVIKVWGRPTRRCQPYGHHCELLAAFYLSCTLQRSVQQMIHCVALCEGTGKDQKPADQGVG